QVHEQGIFLGISFFGLPWVSGSVEDIAVWPGQNVTLFCDCTLSVGTLVAWFRNCSHVNQPSLVLRLKKQYLPHTPKFELMSPLPRFYFVKNTSSNSYNLLITNVTVSDEGLYFCGTDTQKPSETKYITRTQVYNYGKAATRIKMSNKERNGTNSRLNNDFMDVSVRCYLWSDSD
uniref:Ig-like domain-containing protein n=1 Tax=Neogobius melanostomus TaxID=47308 RepID=A0A8C6UF86_9GOBI